MSQPEEGWRVALGPTEWVTVSTPGEAVALGGYIAKLVATIGVERAERERLTAENERLRKAGDAMEDAIRSIDHDKPKFHSNFIMTNAEYKAVNAWNAAKEGRDAK